MLSKRFTLFSNKSAKVSSKRSHPSDELELLIKEPSNLNESILWVTSLHHRNCRYLFLTDPLIIHAEPEIVWREAIKVNQFKHFSNGAITAHIKGELNPGNTVELKLYKNTWKGKLIPSVKAQVIISGKVDDKWVIGWGVSLPFGLGSTKRYQVLKPLPDNKTESVIGDKIPGIVGFFTHLILKKTIQDAFKSLNEGIKKEVESANKLKM